MSIRFLWHLISACCAVQVAPANAQVLRLPVRVHLLQADGANRIATTYSDRQVHQLIRVANEVWQQAEIEWVLESVVRNKAPRAAAFDSLLNGQIRRDREPLYSYFPTDSLLPSGWNVLLIRDFGQIAGGVFFDELGAVALAEHGFGYDLPPDGRGGRTLAHELGHSLGLTHVDCDDARNIMANACWRPGARSTLSAEQIAAARQQAQLGTPVRQQR